MRARRAGGVCAALAMAAVVCAAAPSAAGPRAGRRVEVDARTGRIVPPSGRPVPGPPADQSTSHEGLVERAGRSPGGGVGVHLQGRFRSAVRVERGADGRWSRDCRPGTAPAAVR